MTGPSLFVPDRDTPRRFFCGPMALCAVTGLPASKILAMIEAERGERAYNSRGQPKGVRGTTVDELQRTLYSLGYLTTVRCADWPGPTLAQFLRELAKNPLPGRLIVRIRGHFLAVSGDGKWVCDTKTKVPVLARLAPSRRARVTHVIAIKERSK